jgi:hypothetical protein
MLKRYKLLIEVLSLLLSIPIARLIAQNKFLIELFEKLNGNPLSYTMQIVLLILIIITILLLPYVVYLRIKMKLFPRFGVYWDFKRNPYCPICKKLLSNYNEEIWDDPHFFCISCKDKIYLYDNKGRIMKLRHAVKFLFNRKITEKNIQKFNNQD